MTNTKINALPSEAVHFVRSGAPDAYGLSPERQISGGDGVPCRHCLRQVPAGKPYLVLAWRPFPALQPYAETGPIFLCAEQCPRHQDDGSLPSALSGSDYIVRGYGENDRIVYGTGGVVPTPAIRARAGELLTNPDVAYVHVRSARNNCYQLRIDRA